MAEKNKKRKASEETNEQCNVKTFKLTGLQRYPVDFIKTEADIDDTEFDDAGCVIHCEKCNEQVEVKSPNVSHHHIFGEHSSQPRHRILSLICRSKGQNPHTVGLKIKNSWWTVNEVLTSHDIERDGIQKVTTFGEHIVVSVLNGIIVSSLELQSENVPTFEAQPPGETINIMWQKGVAVGFYSVKKKGKLVSPYSGEVWALNILDTIFVRKSYRRKGLAGAMLEHFLESYPKQDVGLSFPIEKAMLKVCHQVMAQREKDQGRLWECEEPGNPGQRKNIWMTVNNQTFTTQKSDD